MKGKGWNERLLRLMNEDHLSSERLGGLFVLAERKQEDLKKNQFADKRHTKNTAERIGQARTSQIRPFRLLESPN